MSVLITMIGSLNNSENAFKLLCKILNYSNEMRSKHSIIQDSIENNWLISEKREMFESWNLVKNHPTSTWTCNCVQMIPVFLVLWRKHNFIFVTMTITFINLMDLLYLQGSQWKKKEKKKEQKNSPLYYKLSQLKK